MIGRALAAVLSSPWWITPEYLDLIAAIADRDHEIDVEAVLAKRGERYGESRMTIRDGVAIIPVHGPIMRRASFFSQISGATSTNALALMFNEVIEDDDVRAIVLDVDSPGGEVHGLHELASMIFEARGAKPITASITGTGASAAYYIAAAADNVLGSPSAIVGSIGTIMQAVDRSGAQKKHGVRTLDIVSAQSPRKRMNVFDEDPAKRDDARASVQAIVDDLAAVFIADVARFRNVTEEVVAEDFGRGGVMVGAAAVEAGLIDGLAGLEDVVNGLSKSTEGAPGHFRLSAAGGILSHPGGTEEMKETEKPAAEPVAETAETLDVAAERAAAADAERERITGILALDPPAALTADLIGDASCSVGDAAIQIRTYEREVSKAKGKAQIDARADDDANTPTPAASTEPTGAESDRALGKAAARMLKELRTPS